MYNRLYWFNVLLKGPQDFLPPFFFILKYLDILFNISQMVLTSRRLSYVLKPRGVIDTAESDSALSLTLRSFIWHREVRAVFCHDLWKLLKEQSY